MADYKPEHTIFDKEKFTEERAKIFDRNLSYQRRVSGHK